MRVVLALTLLLLTASALAADRGANSQPGKAPTESNARLIFLAAELEDLGRAQEDALLLVNAARLYLKAEGPERKLDGERTKGEGGATAKGKLASVKDVVELARKHAAGDATITALIDQMKIVGIKGNSGGAKFVRDSLASKGQVTYKLEFYSQEFAETTLRGDGAGDLDLTVTDENGNVICQSKAHREREYCSWFPRWKGQFKISVRNQGTGPSNFRLYTN